ncbi:peptide deformylase [Undibacterium sp.]|uniref:peptide deformylase n=1 Tax=Undibacterium sp. TaxID=1914977 RepID=UPI0037529B5E
MSTQILTLGDARLRRICTPVTNLADPQFLNESRDLKAALEVFRQRHGFGRGIAAPQLGIAKRFIALNLGAATFTMINPIITWRSAETFTMWDDCMCFPELLVKLRRHDSISVQFIDEQAIVQNWERIARPIAELLQHEIDHLDGVLATDLATDGTDIISRDIFDANPAQFQSQVDYVITPTIG